MDDHKCISVLATSTAAVRRVDFCLTSLKLKQFGEKLSIDLLRFHCTCRVLLFFFLLSHRLVPREAIIFKMLSVQHLPPNFADDKPSAAEGSRYQAACHPETDYSSIGALCRRAWQRFASIWTRRLILSLLAGQIVSLCITCTSVATEALTSHDWALPTTQTLFLCPLSSQNAC